MKKMDRAIQCANNAEVKYPSDIHAFNIAFDAFNEGFAFSTGIGKTAYIKGIRRMANALKNYDRTDGAWTDYFEHTVDEVLKMLLSEVLKENEA